MSTNLKHENMKNVRLMVLATITTLFMGINNINAQEKEYQTVIIRTFECNSIPNSSHISITSPDGSTKIIELNNFAMTIKNSEFDIKNSIAIQSEINNWKKQGFIIDGVSNAVYSNALVTTIILSK